MQFWEFAVIMAWVVAVALPAAVLHYFLDLSIGLSIGLGIAVAVGLFLGWVFLSGRKRMHYSVEADAAFRRAVEEIQTVLVAESESIRRVEGIWLYGYPKVAILFATDEALRQAKENGLLDRIAGKAGETVRRDTAFGPNRESFDQRQAVWATAERQKLGFNG